jgi:hypothetical protein
MTMQMGLWGMMFNCFRRYTTVTHTAKLFCSLGLLLFLTNHRSVTCQAGNLDLSRLKVNVHIAFEYRVALQE